MEIKKIDIIKLLVKNKVKESEANQIASEIISSANKKDLKSFYDELKNNPNDYKSILKKFRDKRSDDWKEERTKEKEKIKKTYSKDSQEYLEYAIEEYVYRDLILNSIAFDILANRENGLKIVEWLEKNNKKITDKKFIKKCFEIRIKDTDYQDRAFDKKDYKLMKLIKEKDYKKVLSDPEIRFIVSQTNTYDYTRDYLYDKLKKLDLEKNKFDKHIKHYVMDLLCNPSYMIYKDADKEYKSLEKKNEKIQKALLKKLKEYKNKNILTEDDVQEIYSKLYYKRRYSLLLEYIESAEANGEELTKENINRYVSRIRLDLCYKNYEVLQMLGFSQSLNSIENKKRLERYIDTNSEYVFIGDNYNYINAKEGPLQMNQILSNNDNYDEEESIDNTIFGISNQYTWNVHMKSDVKIGQYAFFTEKRSINDDDYRIPMHIMNDEINPQCKVNNTFEVQVSSFALNIAKEKDTNDNIIFYNNCIPKLNTLVSSATSRFYELNKDLCLYKGIVKDIKKFLMSLYDEKIITNQIIVDTQFGELPIYCSDEILNGINVGDIVEAPLYITVDVVLELDEIRNQKDLISDYQFLKLAFEKRQSRILYNTVSDDVTYIDDSVEISGKFEVLDYLQRIMDKNYKDYCGMYTTVITRESSDESLKVGDEVLTSSRKKEFSPYEQYKIELNGNNLIDKIIRSNDSKTLARIIRGFSKTNNILTRKELVEKYVNYPIPDMTNPTFDNYIKYYETHISLLNELKEDLYEIHRKPIKEKCELNIKQQFCKKKCYLKDEAWNEEYQQYRQSFYEMIDFIYHPAFKNQYADEYLTTIEVTEVLELVDFLIDIAYKLIQIHQNNNQ